MTVKFSYVLSKEECWVEVSGIGNFGLLRVGSCRIYCLGDEVYGRISSDSSCGCNINVGNGRFMAALDAGCASAGCASAGMCPD